MRTVPCKIAVCLLMGFFLVGSSLTDSTAGAAEYPTRAITLIVPYPAGGVTDLGARVLADAMEKHLKQPVVVMNKVGGGSTIGGYAVASAKPDGYTLGFFPIAPNIPEAFEFLQGAPYSSADLTPISGVITPFMTVTSKEDAPWNSFKELIEYAKKNPGVKMGSTGKQTIQYMFSATLNRTEKTGFSIIPFSGDSTNLAALLGGHIQAAIIDYSAISSLVDAKKLKALAVVTTKRADFAPNVPTVEELGYPSRFLSVIGVAGPKGLPEEIVKKIDDVIAKICTEPEFRTKLRNTALGIYYKGPAAYKAHIASYRENVLAFSKEEGLEKK